MHEVLHSGRAQADQSSVVLRTKVFLRDLWQVQGKAVVANLAVLSVQQIMLVLVVQIVQISVRGELSRLCSLIVIGQCAHMLSD